MKNKINSSLAQDLRVMGLIHQILVPAIAAGLPEEQAEAIYAQLGEHYSRIDGRAFEAWRRDLLKILDSR